MKRVLARAFLSQGIVDELARKMKPVEGVYETGEVNDEHLEA